MPLQNRVTPFGDIVALPGRGTLTGNRGVLHDDHRTIVRRWTSRRWIACELEYRGIRRTIMAPHRWTELFFLDEAAAFSAGHRPCAECRRAEYKEFRTRWEGCRETQAGADAIDAVLHAQRLNGRAKRLWRADVATLPDGAYIVLDGKAHIVWDAQLAAWSDAGYCERRNRPSHLEVDVLTAQAIVGVLRSGYRPRVHPSL